MIRPRNHVEILLHNDVSVLLIFCIEMIHFAVLILQGHYLLKVKFLTGHRFSI